MPPKPSATEPKKQQIKKEDVNIKSKRDQSPSKSSENIEFTKAENAPKSPKSPKEQKIVQQEEKEEDYGNEETKKNKKQAEMFKKYLDQTGIAMAFQVIFAEILDKKINENKLFEYTAMRLRQIGQDLQKIKINKK